MKFLPILCSILAVIAASITAATAAATTTVRVVEHHEAGDEANSVTESTPTGQEGSGNLISTDNYEAEAHNKWRGHLENLTALLDAIDDDGGGESGKRPPTSDNENGSETHSSTLELSTTTKRSVSPPPPPKPSPPYSTDLPPPPPPRRPQWTVSPAPKSLILAVQPEECVEFGRLPGGGASDFVAEPGAALNVSCLTRVPHEWSSTAASFEPDRQVKWYDSKHRLRHIVSIAGVDYSDFPFRSTLHLEDVSFLSVGKYTCKNTQVESDNEVLEPVVAAVEQSAYLFVSDHSHPTLLSSALDPSWRGRAEVGRPLVLPCRPAHPDHRVKLIRRGLDVTPGFDYSPKSGFVLSPKVATEEESSELAGEYRCVFSSPWVFEAPRALAVVEDVRRRHKKKQDEADAEDNDKEAEDNEADGESGAVVATPVLSLLVMSASLLSMSGPSVRFS